MAVTQATLVTKLTTDNKQFGKGMRGARSELKSLAKTALAAAAPLAAVFGAKAAIQAANVQIRAEQKLGAVLKATGGAAGLTAKEIKNYAGELQKVTDFGDELTINAAAQLATFTQIRGDIFKEALAISQDMSSVLDTDLKGSIIQVGKALNDPIAGMTALTRSGVSFTEEQKKQIRNFQEQGDILGAQQVILAELKKEFGGAAQAMANPITQLKNAIGDVGESIGFLLIEPMRVFAKDMSEAFGSVDQSEFQAIGKSLADDFAPASKTFAETMKSIVPVMAFMAVELAKIVEFWTDISGLSKFVAQQQLATAKAQGLELDRALAAQRRLKEGRGTEEDRMLVARTRESAGRATDEDRAVLQRADQAAKAPADLDTAIASGREFIAPWAEFGNVISDATKEAVAFAGVKFDEEFAAKRKKMDEEAKQLFESTRTPMERFEQEQQRLLELFQAGAIDEDLFKRGIAMAGDALPEDQQGGGDIGGVAAVDARSADAFSSIQAAIRGGMKDPVQDRMLKAEERAAKFLATIEQNTRNLGGGTDADSFG